MSSASRLRLSKSHVERLKWPISKNDVDLIGFFRNKSELVCCPQTTDIDNNPLAAVLSLIPDDDGKQSKLELLPAARFLLLQERLIWFKGHWTAAQNQIDLQLGADNLRKLGWTNNKKNQVHATIFGGQLVLMSPDFYEAAISAEVLS